jgi:hypothetical protein
MSQNHGLGRTGDQFDEKIIIVRGALMGFEAGYRRGLGPRGTGTRFFLFDAGMVHACEKGGISIPYDGEIYSWDTPFPGCSQ